MHHVVPRRTAPAVDPPFLRDGGEELLVPTDRLRAAEEEIAAFAKREVKERDQPLLGVRLQVDEQVPAGDHVEPREGWIGEQVLDCEHDEIAQGFPDLVRSVVLVEVLADLVRWQPRQRRLGIDAVARPAQVAPIWWTRLMSSTMERRC